MSMTMSLSHHFDAFELQLEVETAGGITALFGRSGAGKSTIINMVAGLLAPDQGRIEVDGITVLDTDKGISTPPHQRGFATVFQDARLFPHLDVLGNLQFGAQYAVGSPKIAQNDVIDLLGLSKLLTRAPATLSGGEKQRVALGRALLSQPRLLLMDEPLASLDAPRKDEILPYLEHLRHEPLGLQVLYVSHDMDEIARLADTLILLQNGQVAASGPITDVLSDPSIVPLIGARAAGSVIEATVTDHASDGLTALQLSAGVLHIAGVQAAIGSQVRLRVLAKDVILARDRPDAISAQNILKVTIDGIHLGDGPGAAVALKAGNDRLLARITARAVKQLGLEAGMHCYAILKATSVAPSNISR